MLPTESEIKSDLNPTAPRKAKIVYNFGLPECNRVNDRLDLPELYISGSSDDNYEMIFLISPYKHIVICSLELTQ